MVPLKDVDHLVGKNTLPESVRNHRIEDDHSSIYKGIEVCQTKIIASIREYGDASAERPPPVDMLIRIKRPYKKSSNVIGAYR